MLTSISRTKSHFIFLLAATLFPQYDLLAKCKETNTKSIYLSVNSDKYLRITYGIDKTNTDKELILYKDLYQVAANKNEQPKLIQKNIEINALAEKVCLKEGETGVASNPTGSATVAAIVPGASVSPAVNEAISQANKANSKGWVDDEANGVSKRRSIGEHGESIVETRTMDGRIVKDYYDSDTGRQLRPTEVVAEGVAKKTEAASPVTSGSVDPGISAGDIAREDAKFARQSEAAKSGDGLAVGDIKTDKTVTDPAKLPSDADVSKASFTLQNAATALQGANDIVGGMKAGGLKGFAQAATGAINIAQMLDPIDANKMSASAKTFAAEVKNFTARFPAILTPALQHRPHISTLNNAVAAYMTATEKCTNQLSTSKGVCNELKNGNAMAVTQLMTAGAGLIQNLSSASETCGTTADLTKVAGLGMAGVGTMCSQNMTVCKSDCSQTGVTLKQVHAALEILEKTLGVDSKALVEICASTTEGNPMGPQACKDEPDAQSLLVELNKIKALAKKEEGTTVGSTTLACAGLGLQVLNFANQVSDLIKSSDDADKCKKALTAGNGTGGGSAITNITTEEMCKNSANASMQVCKCHKDATAEGCPGAIAKALSKDPGGLTIKGGSGVSQLAGFGNKSGGTAGTNISGGGSGGDSGGLSEAAKQALGLTGGNASTTAAGGVSGTNTATDSGSDPASKSLTDAAKSKKFDFGSFGSIGSGISNFFGGKSNAKKAGGGAVTDKQIEKAKRQIASAQLRNEVSTASGKSNWDKIRARYVENRGSFMGD